MRNLTCLLISLITFLTFCCAEQEDGDNTVPSTSTFSEAELSVLNSTLNLPPNLYNYANPDLPQHYRSGEVQEFDNTPDNNPITDMGATLGRVLFYDKKLSANNSISCASCHEQSAAFSDNRTFSIGLNGEKTVRNSMSLINSRYYENGRFMWDERAATLEEQVLLPIQDHVEMGMNLRDLVVKLQELDYYNLLFEKSFGSPQVTEDRIARSLAQFTRSIVSYSSKFDKALVAAGNPPVDEKMPLLSTLNQQEQLGMDIFLRGRNGATCGYCHGTAQMVNDEAKNNGLSMFYADQGKGKITRLASDMALFKVPSLKNIAKTAPYMHDGRFETLMEVVDHYSDNVQAHPNLNFRLTTLDDGEAGTPELLKLNLNQQEKEALVAFLHTLTDEEVLTDPKFSDPFKQ